MIFRYPEYYDSFRCIADRCEDTCCAGWEIDIDDESYAYYKSVPGEFGERLRRSIKEYGNEEENAYGSHGFLLRDDKKCPFLNEQGLCDLYRELGEEALCDVCTYTPRNIFEYGRERELAVSASCPEAGRLIFQSDKPAVFLEREIEGELDFEETEEEVLFAHQIRDARDSGIRILQNRNYPIEERIAVFLRFAENIQKRMNENAVSEISSVQPEWGKGMPDARDDRLCYELFLKRMRTFTGMESIREDWYEMMELLQARYNASGDGWIRYRDDAGVWRRFILSEGREYEYEHLLVYYAFMCLPRCVDDYDFIGKVKLCVTSFLMLRDMDMAWYCEKGEFKKEDRVRMSRIYAKEVEHSEENLDYLAEEFLFEDAYKVENLLYSL